MKGITGVWMILILGLGTYIGCAEVKFSAEGSCSANSAGNCILNPDGTSRISGTEVVNGGKVDVLIVDDNSASMSFEQKALSSRFFSFMGLLDSKAIDYRLAITTTDISSNTNPARSINQNGALQDGNLITLEGGHRFLTPQTGTSDVRNDIFRKAIERTETLNCEKFILGWNDSGRSTTTAEYADQYLANCPSSDERGLYALGLVAKNNPESFLRSDADLAVIVLSDEDVRSQKYWYGTPGFELDEFDTAQGVLKNIKSLYPQKKVAIHAFLTKTEACLAIQNAQTRALVSGSYGLEYFKATQLSGGIAGSICPSSSGQVADDFTFQLRAIFDNINANVVDRIALSCANPSDLTVEPSGIKYSVIGDQIKFDKKLPVGTTVKYAYTCPAKVN